MFEAAADPTVREITVVCGAQMGKTEALLCILGHRFADGPRTQTLVIQPSQDLARSFSDDRVTKLLRHTPVLNRITDWPRARQQEKWVAGLRLGIAWAGSPIQLSSVSVGCALADERDRFPDDVKGEGDPITLIRARTKNFARSLLIITSTPTEDDASPIQAHFEDGSMEFFEWQCPHCAEWFRPRGELLHWPDDSTPQIAEIEGGLYCPECGAEVEDRHKATLNATGRYRQYDRDSDGRYFVAPSPTPGGSARSFWISGLCSPWVTFGRVCRELVGAQRSGDPARIMAVTNVYLGETYKTAGEAPRWEEVYALAKEYRPGDIPTGCVRATMGVDVQKNGLFYVIRGWGPNMTSWLLREGFIAGDTAFDDVWVTLSQVLSAPIRTVSIERCFIDMGYRPGFDEGYRRPDHQVYLWCRRHMGRAFPIQGKDTQDTPLRSNPIDITINGAKIQAGLILWKTDTDYAKSWIHSRIRWPDTAESGGWWLHSEATEDYCRQIVAEELVVKPSGHRVWKKPHRRANHYLDCEVYALSAAMSLHMEATPTVTSSETAPVRRRPVSSSKFARRRL